MGGPNQNTRALADVWPSSRCPNLSITAPEGQKSVKIDPPGPIIDDLERRIGTNPSERSLKRSVLVHSKAKEDKCDSS